jgi:hypothetical protein
MADATSIADDGHRRRDQHPDATGILNPSAPTEDPRTPESAT